MNYRHGGQFAQRALAALGATALVLGGTLGLSTAASAEDAVPVPGPSPSNITGTEGTLVIHKFGGDPVDMPNDGKPIADVSGLGEPLDGVEFSIQRVSYDGVPIDLKTFDGWDQAQGATPANVSAAPYSLSPASTPSVTTVGGVATASNLPFGLYLVTETSPGTNPIVSPVQPFLVSVPYPDATNSTWLYTVHVYPKNKLNETEPEKTVAAPDGVTLGSEVKWTITAPVPELADWDTYKEFVITDDLDSRLSLTGVAVTLDGSPLVLGVDYTLTPLVPPTVAGGPLVTVTLTGALADLDGADNVVVELTTTVDSLGDGKILNQGFVNVNDSVRETNQPQTNWGPLQVIKKAAVAPNNTLQGAEFTLHETKGGAALAEVGTLTTDANGEIFVDGLWVGNGATLSKTYWLQETKAPAGYVLPTGDAAWTEVTVNAGSAASAVAVVINNTQQNAPRLPLTGSTGTLAFMVGGAALLVAAGGIALAAARRRQGASKQ